MEFTGGEEGLCLTQSLPKGAFLPGHTGLGHPLSVIVLVMVMLDPMTRVPNKLLPLILGALILAGCSSPGNGPSSPSSLPTRPDHPISVVAAENSWGSIASLLGGDRVEVHSLIQDPNVDPHEYEATPADARLVANAQLVVNNGGGYDAWMQQLLSPGARVPQHLVTAAVLVPSAAAANPHLFASPGVVALRINQITANLEVIDPASRSYFKKREALVMADWKRWDEALLAIAARHRASPVGATETMALPMLARASLQVITAQSFMHAISQGIEPAPQDLANFNYVIDHHRINVLVTNSQTVTPLTAGLVSRAQAAGIPVLSVVEILPPGKSFFQLVDAEAAALAQALDSASP